MVILKNYDPDDRVAWLESREQEIIKEGATADDLWDLTFTDMKACAAIASLFNSGDACAVGVLVTAQIQKAITSRAERQALADEDRLAERHQFDLLERSE